MRRIVMVLLIVGVVGTPFGARAKERAFSARVEWDAALATPVVELAYRDPRGGKPEVQVRVAPELGANLFSLRYAGHELLWSESPEGLRKGGGGTPVLFPTPNRVRDSVFTFGGQRFEFAPNNGKNFIHGLVRGKRWDFAAPRAGATGARLEAAIEWDERQEDFARFPIRHRLAIEFSLSETGLRLTFTVENRDDKVLPFGVGLHPWFRVPGRKDDVFIAIPAAQRMDAVDKLPTGVLLAVAGSDADLRTPRALTGMSFDDVFFGVNPKSPPVIEWRDLGVRLILGGSREFGHVVVYTPDRPVFCIENQTSSTDAHNLFAAGKTQESGLLVVRGRKKKTVMLNWRLQSMAAPASR